MVVDVSVLRRDIAPLPDLLHGRSRSGPVREQRPVYVDLLPPCNAGCPAGENIQAWLAHVQAGEHELAWRALVADNPFAAIHGRVCYHPCESVCNRANLDSAVSIHAVERYLGDMALERGWLFDPPPSLSGKRVLVIGAGPSGLSAAYHLARLGHEVEIRDAGSEPGGMMRYGIPAYRMPRDVLSGELERIAALGVRFTSNHVVVDLEAERREDGFDAAFVAVGAHLSKRVDIPAMDAGPIVDAVSFLRGVASGERPLIGRRVAVYGGGNTAMDAARTARRLGAEETLVVYRRTREQMPAHEEEAQDAEREGVRINWLRTIKTFEGPELNVEVMELDELARAGQVEQLDVALSERPLLGVDDRRREELPWLALPARVVDDVLAAGREARLRDASLTKRHLVEHGLLVPAEMHGSRRPRDEAREERRRRAGGRPDGASAQPPPPVLPPSTAEIVESEARSNATSFIDWKRFSGAFSRQWKTTRSSAGGI